MALVAENSKPPGGEGVTIRGNSAPLLQARRETGFAATVVRHSSSRQGTVPADVFPAAAAWTQRGPSAGAASVTIAGRDVSGHEPAVRFRMTIDGQAPASANGGDVGEGGNGTVAARFY